MTVVVDASVALGWIFERTNAVEAERAKAVLAGLRDQAALVPELWHAELVNALLVAERRNAVTMSKAIDFLSRLGELPIHTDGAAQARKESVLSLGRQYGLSAYDATYLDLALRTGSALATFDKALARARDRAGVRAE